MADSPSLAMVSGADRSGPPRLVRRLRALARRAGQAALKLAGRAPIEGFVDGEAAGEIRGWALDPSRPGRRVHVVAVCAGQVVAEALADLSRMDLVQDGRGDGQHGFRLRLPAAVLDGTARRVRVEAVAGAGRVRLVRGELTLRADEGAAPAPGGPSPRPRNEVAAQRTVALLVWGEVGSDAAARTQASWAGQTWEDRTLAFAGDDDASLRQAHTVLIARAGDLIDADAARLLAEARPLSDVVTWDAPGGRRPEARALGVLLGETLGGAFAVRGHVFDRLQGSLELDRGPRRMELRLAADAALRWTHLPAALLTRAEAICGWSPIPRDAAEGLEGFDWREAEGGRPSRLVPSRRPERLTLAAWPASGAAFEASLAGLIGAADPHTEIEVLAAGLDKALEDRLRGAAGEAGDRLSIRPVDPPTGDGAGAWLRVLGEAATGEVVLLCRAGLSLSPGPGALDELAAWALSPLVGAATVRIESGGGPVAGLAVSRTADGWRAVPALPSASPGQSHPVLAAPAALLAVSRARLAAIGGIDADRFPDAGADLDLGLQLRRMGCASLVLGDLEARLGVDGATPEGGAWFGGFDPEELAAAAFAYGPASEVA